MYHPGVDRCRNGNQGPLGYIRLADAAKAVGAAKPKRLCEWLDGTWLEYYTLEALRRLSATHELHDVRMTIKPIGRTKFEFDVAVIRGYQLFAFSCSVEENKPLLKHKLFEAYVRTRQFGGDEARVALVCCYGDVPRLRNDVRKDISPDQVYVFGKDDLKDLQKNIGDWIRQESKMGQMPRSRP
jgi:hypothetical protein